PSIFRTRGVIPLLSIWCVSKVYHEAPAVESAGALAKQVYGIFPTEQRRGSSIDITIFACRVPPLRSDRAAANLRTTEMCSRRDRASFGRRLRQRRKQPTPDLRHVGTCCAGSGSQQA